MTVKNHDLASKAGLLVSYYITLSFWSAQTLALSMVSRNIAGQTKKSTVVAMTFVSWAVGNAIGKSFFEGRTISLMLDANEQSLFQAHKSSLKETHHDTSSHSQSISHAMLSLSSTLSVCGSTSRLRTKRRTVSLKHRAEAIRKKPETAPLRT